MAILTGCEGTDVSVATDAGMDAVKALTLSDKDVLDIAREASERMDKKNDLAPPNDKYARRLAQLIGRLPAQAGQAFDVRVYLASGVNALAMANGTIRVYSGLMDLLDDGELQFVVGHEMGHVVKNHLRQKVRLAYAASAVRKGVASQTNGAGDVARSVVGDLAEKLLNAQFSQLEEKEADDHGLALLKGGGFQPSAAVSALRKLAKLGSGHSFLSSHPDPDKRAQRLQAQLDGKALPIEESRRNLIGSIVSFIKSRLPSLFRLLGLSHVKAHGFCGTIDCREPSFSSAPGLARRAIVEV